MTEPVSFNLWTEPWITLERPDGEMEVLGIAQTLTRAHRFRALYEPSPLVIVGVHRLLTAILQAIYDPQRTADLKRLWAAGWFDPDKIADFGAQFAHRFDLFSADMPFMQSADLPMGPQKRPTTFVASLFNEIASGSNVTHFNHGNESNKKCCAACAAGGLISLSAFALPAGRGYSTSVAGVPPIYVLPLGVTLFHSLAASILLPAYKPKVASEQADYPCWNRSSVIGKSTALSEIGYLQGLTFTPRRVRLHPTGEQVQCSRCGKRSSLCVNAISYEAGEKLADDFPFWQDPFIAYMLGKQEPSPIHGSYAESCVTGVR